MVCSMSGMSMMSSGCVGMYTWIIWKVGREGMEIWMSCKYGLYFCGTGMLVVVEGEWREVCMAMATPPLACMYGICGRLLHCICERGLPKMNL